MIDLNEIKKCTNDRFFQRGRDLYNIGKVLSIDIEKDEESGLINVKGDVRGSGRNIYQATVGIDDEFIVFSECECPASLVYNWKEELARFAPALNAETLTGTQKERKEKISRYQEWDVLITSYDLLKRDIHEYEGCQFRGQVLDEAQYIKIIQRLRQKR